MIFKEISVGEVDLLSDFFSRDPKLFKKTVTSEASKAAFDGFVKYFKENPTLVTCYGAFVNGELCGVMSGIRWTKMPYYTVGYLKVHNTSGSLRFYVKVFDGLLTSLIEKFEAEKRFDFYFINYQRNFHKKYFEENRRQRAIPGFFSQIHRYELFVQDVIPPGQVSTYSVFNEIMGKRTFEVPVWIRKASLKPEFRNKLFPTQSP